MRRTAATRAILLCAIFNLPTLVAQDSAPSSSPGGTIQNISFRSDGEAVTITVTTSKAVLPQFAHLVHPDRLVVDFPGFALAPGNQETPVNNGAVLAVRASLFRSNPAMSRVVVDLKQPVETQIKAAGNTLWIKLSPKEGLAGGQPTRANLETPAVNDARSAPPESSLAPPPAVGVLKQSRAKTSEYELLDKARALTLDDLKALDQRVEAGDPEAETILALAYHSAVLLKNDETEALRLLRKAAGKGFLPAEESLAIFCASGIGMDHPDPGEALTWYTKAARQGSVDAATNIATMYATANGVPRDINAAITWFQRAAEAGGATAQYNLALIYGRGDGVPRDDPKSLDWLRKAADQDVIPALLDLANRFLHPRDGSKPDVRASIQRYQRAAELGDGLAQAILGDIFSAGTLIPVDYPQAVKWYRLSAEQGQKDGEFGLAARYVLGQGVEADQAEAFRWFKAAADQGHANAQYNVARLYETGNGVPRDLNAAVRYYELAAQQGVVKSQYRLGVLLAKGEGVKSDAVSAYKWLLLAQDSVHDSAVALNDLRKSMAASEIADAEHQVDAWRLAHKDSPRESLAH
jgi:hypothetical protein